MKVWPENALLGLASSTTHNSKLLSAAKLFGMSGLWSSEERCGLNTSSFLPSKDVFLSDAQRAIGKNLGLLAEENKPLSIGRNDCCFNMGLRWKREEGSNRLFFLHAHLSLGWLQQEQDRLLSSGPLAHSCCTPQSVLFPPAPIWSCPVPLKTSHYLPIEVSLNTWGSLPSISPYAPHPLTPGLRLAVSLPDTLPSSLSPCPPAPSLFYFQFLLSRLLLPGALPWETPPPEPMTRFLCPPAPCTSPSWHSPHFIVISYLASVFSGDGQGGLAYCSSWGCKESDMTERLNWTETISSRRAWTGCVFLIHGKRHRDKNDVKLVKTLSLWSKAS